MLLIVKVVLSDSVLSSSRRRRTTSIARSVGIWLKSETTSKDSSISPLHWPKSPEFFNADVE